MSAFSLTVERNIAHLVFDLPGGKVNTFSAAVVSELNAILEQLARQTDLRALVFTSAKPDVFIAGADIKELQLIATVEEGYSKARAGQQLFQRLADLPFPSLAVIDGACLGGGLECALACTFRLVTDADKTSLGLPEVTLGILPGWGGTQRLPSLVGPSLAVDLILSGRTLNGLKAFKSGLADRICARAFLADTVATMVEEITTPTGRAKLLARRASLRRFPQTFIDGIGRPLLWSQAHKTLMRKTKGAMPAPLAALAVIKRTYGGSLAAGLEAEARAFSTLAMTSECRCLIDAFFANEEAKKQGLLPKPSTSVGAGGQGEARSLGGGAPQPKAVLGAGVMGGGIAWLLAHKGMQVRVKDLTWEALAKAYKTVDEYSNQLVKRKKLTRNEARQRLLRVGGSVDWSGFAGCDVVIEAVVENLEVKKKVLAEAETVVRSDCILATNTSSLRVADLAQALTHPERLVGMHFFNPVNRMPLVEVVAGPRSSPEAVATIAALARQCGKTAIVVQDCPGFLVNRILLPYMNEAARCLTEGGDLREIDRAISRYGMPMGPFVLTDEVGIDVGHKVAKILHEGYGERMAVAPILAKVHEELKLLGTKAGKGFYLHEGKTLRLNPDIDAAIAGTQDDLGIKPRVIESAEILDRCLLIMANEAARCIDEVIVASPGLLDLAMLMGTGYPPQKGGPLHHIDSLGAAEVVARLRRLATQHGPRFEPCRLLITMAEQQSTFFGGLQPQRREIP